MDPLVTSSLIGMGSDVFGGLLGARGQRDANRMNRQLMREQMAWQEQMSSSAVQRRMLDMKKAGINPMLAGKFDASTPAGSLATMGNPNANLAANLAGSGDRAINSAIAMKTNKKQLELMDAQIFKTYEEGGLAYDRRGLTQVMKSKGLQEILNLQTAREVAKLDAELKALEIPGLKAEANFWKWLDEAGADELAKAAGKAGPILAPLLRIFLFSGRIKGGSRR